MASTNPQSEANLSATPPPQTTPSKTRPQRQRTRDELQQDLEYLRDHKICEKLEFIAKNLLKNQPEDPILAVCNMLRESNRGRTSVRAAASGAGNLPPASPSVASSGACSPNEPIGPSFEAAAAGVRADGGRMSGPMGRVGTPGSAGNNGLGGRRDSMGYMSSNGNRLERDESARSEASMFSITSVDMCEFLAEFRAAHYGLFGGAHEMITKLDLASIVDQVALPLPDVRILVDLFAELDIDGHGRVPFEAFLARMNYKIQGRYPIETIRAIYYTVAGGEDPHAGSPEAVNSLTSPVTVPSGASTPSSSTQATKGMPRATLGMGSATDVATTQAAGEGIIKKQFLDEGLWKGLGIRLNEGDFARITSQLGIPNSDTFAYHVTDFTRIVQAAAGGSTRDVSQGDIPEASSSVTA